MERFGFVGLPNAGKSSLYNALAGGGALAAPYAFATTDPNEGVARVPDSRLTLLGEMSNSQKIGSATIQFTDIGGTPVLDKRARMTEDSASRPHSCANMRTNKRETRRTVHFVLYAAIYFIA